jgi:hypothetical protein
MPLGGSVLYGYVGLATGALVDGGDIGAREGVLVEDDD